MFPIHLDTTHVKILVVGQGEAFLRRIEQVRESGAQNLFVIEDVDAPKHLIDQVISGARLVFVAGCDEARTEVLCTKARQTGALVNAEDNPQWCDFHVPAMVRRGDLTIAVSSGGKSPGLVRAIRKHLEAQFGPEWASRLDEVSAFRERLRTQGFPLKSVSQRTEEFLKARGWL